MDSSQYCNEFKWRLDVRLIVVRRLWLSAIFAVLFISGKKMGACEPPRERDHALRPLKNWYFAGLTIKV